MAGQLHTMLRLAAAPLRGVRDVTRACMAGQLHTTLGLAAVPLVVDVMCHGRACMVERQVTELGHVRAPACG